MDYRCNIGRWVYRANDIDINNNLLCLLLLQKEESGRTTTLKDLHHSVQPISYGITALRLEE